MQDTAAYVRAQAAAARNAYYDVSAADSSAKNAALLRTAELLDKHRTAILAANRQDMENAETKGLDAAMLDRLQLSGAGIDNICEGLHQIAALPDPVGEMDEFRTRPNGLQIGKMRVPLGVIGIIYESRPNVTADAVCFIEDTAREGVGAMLQSPDLIDVIIPRGGKSLVARIAAEARVPVIKHLDGICHVYLDEFADPEKAVSIAFNAKTSRYGTCNTMETLLVHTARAAELLPPLAEKYREKGVELRGCPQTLSILPDIQTASDQDWDTEYLAPVLAVKIVGSLEEAVAHINRHGSGHTDSIVTEHLGRARAFLRAVDSASVMVNASTRFADGFEYGLGAEIGISTDKIHVRGPVGLHGLTSQKWIVLGNGQIRT